MAENCVSIPLLTTLGYIEKEDCYLMMHRISKKNDLNQGKWIGVGGKVEKGESPLECMKRECLEETGLTWNDPALKGVITFNFYQNQQLQESEIMFLYHGTSFSGELGECSEGVLEWVPISHIPQLNLWQGDLLFLHRLQKQEEGFFEMRLDYDGDHLIFASCNGEIILQDHPEQEK